MSQLSILFLVKRFCTLLEGKKLRVWSGLKYFLMRLYICTKVCFKTRIQQNQETGFANNERVRDGIKYYCQGLLRSARIKINQWWLAPVVWPWSWETLPWPLIGQCLSCDPNTGL